MSQRVVVVKHQVKNVSVTSWREQLHFDEMIIVSACARPTPLVGFNSTSLLK